MVTPTKLWLHGGMALLLTLPFAPAFAQNVDFQKITLRYRDGRAETYNYGLPPFIVITPDTVTVHYLKDKQTVPRKTVQAICHDTCPDKLTPVTQDTIVWDGRKPLETKGRVVTDASFTYLQDGKVPVKNAGFDRVRYIQFSE